MNKIWEENDTEQKKIDKLSDICETVQNIRVGVLN